MRLGSGTFAAGLVVIEVLGVALFLRGFFPAPVRSAPGTEQRAAPPVPEPAAGATSNWTKLPPPLFSKVVIMLIDALRDDFVFGSKGMKYMPYTTYVMEKGESYSFVAEAKPPTVTMPRIKALMTGSLPGFIDIVRNLNSPALLEDSVIGQAAAAGKRIIFYGDETWVKLFPKHFVEYDGTTSFFVSDYTEVDDNVTRHLDGVLGRRDWDVLILHYLGLDHIGHVFGPSSPLVGRKLREMDGVLMKVHTALLSEEKETLSPTLLVLCGDHGMSETGSHGASSREEVNTPLVLVSSSFARKPGDVRRPEHAQQTDLAATLAVGLGVPIPESSVGRLLLPVVEGRPLREQLRLLHLNAAQLSRLLRENVPSHQKEPGFEQFKMSERLHGSWVQLYLEGGSTEVLLGLGAKVRRQYLGALKTLSMSLSRQVAQYDVYSMAVGTVVVLEVLALLLLSTPWALGREAELEVPLSSPAFSLLFYLVFLVLLAIHVVVCTSAEGTCYLCSLPWLAAGGVMLLASALFCAAASALAKALASVQRPAQNNPARWASSWSEVDLLILLGTAGHALSLGASSFVEEEHQTWYFLVSTLCLALCHEVCRNCFLGNPQEPQEEPAGRGPGLLDQAPRSPSPTSALLKSRAQWRVLAGPWAVLACCRLLRALNRTGVQWAHRPGLGHWLASSEHKAALSALCALSLAGIFALAHQRCSRVSRVALALGLLGVYCYRAAVGSVLFPWQTGNRAISKGVAEARAVFVAVLGLLAAGARDVLGARGPAAGLRELHGGLVLLAALLLRPHNLPVLLGCLLVQRLMAACVWRPLRPGAAAVAAMHHWFGQAFFFFQGNSNSVASVDVSAGCVGLDGYARVPAALLTAFATYAGPVLWASHLASFLASEASSSALSHACFCYALVCSLPVSAYIVLVTSLRYHLFIWSVFSPKLLYEGTRLLVTAAVCVLFTVVHRHHPGPRQSCSSQGK
ncbi:GPI ethanolamine phosphate transferase 2 isoform X2 [Talpa occidentalis]|uniref:GPI ethanolamine phosphate transferase 2 isoform X2 n=1 Tax=Talpa occidentalis TaxID=50954 RepID=UPI0018908700|nr:GPI ethanolamine phosphate transferase 2 isoform X2 [Talpa occidentalis]